MPKKLNANNKKEFIKDRKVNQNFDSLPREEQNILRNAGAGVAFDAVDTSNNKSKANISSQNADTGLPSYNSDDTRPYEQKNISVGFHKSEMGSK